MGKSFKDQIIDDLGRTGHLKCHRNSPYWKKFSIGNLISHEIYSRDELYSWIMNNKDHPIIYAYLSGGLEVLKMLDI